MKVRRWLRREVGRAVFEVRSAYGHAMRAARVVGPADVYRCAVEGHAEAIESLTDAADYEPGRIGREAERVVEASKEVERARVALLAAAVSRE